MKDWGYKIIAARQIDMDLNDFSISDYVSKHENSFKWCIGCGSCSATCTAAQFTDFSLRKVILLIQRGETIGLSKEISKCMMCGKCQIICPRGVNTRSIIHHVKRSLSNVGSF